ncbi:MAG TPA: TonB family protein [Methylomirabilota bacterium]
MLGLLVAFTVLAGGLDVRPARAQPGDVRVVTVRAVADEMYRAQPGWEAMLRRTIQTVSAIYERQFQIRLVVHDVVPWTIGRGVPVPRILARVRAEVSTGPADVLVVFAAERCEKLEYGFAQTFGRYAMVQTGCLDTAMLTNTAPEAVLSHEMAHLFGGFHPAAGRSDIVMRGGPADRFDDQTARVIRLMRGYDFARGVLGLDPEVRRTWSAIYAEGHQRGDTNPLAGALAGAAAEMGRAGRTEEGLVLLREAVALDPTSARTRTIAGYLYLRQGRLEDAAREFDAAKKISFREVEARTELGFVLLRLGREDEALVELRDVLRIDRRAPRAYVGIGMILARRDRIPEAITAFRNAIQVDPTHGPAYLRLAEALDRSGRPVEAWSAAEQAHDRGEDVARAFWQTLTEKVPAAPALPPPCADAAAAPVDLDNPDPAYRGYVARVRERVHAHLMYPRAAGERGIAGELQVEFRIGREGRIECVAVRRSSGSELLDRYVLSAVRLAQPFAPLPSHVPPPSLPVSGTFRFRIDEGPGAVARPR